jgi:hypothetical protein
MKNEKEVDWELVDRKLRAGCTGVEIAACLGMHPDTLYLKTRAAHAVTFSVYSQQKRADGESNLREAQYNKAMQGDNTMLVWLGKNRLKQSDSPQEVSVSAETVSQFNSLMSQISSLQEERKREENSKSNDKKS